MLTSVSACLDTELTHKNLLVFLLILLPVSFLHPKSLTDFSSAAACSFLLLSMSNAILIDASCLWYERQDYSKEKNIFVLTLGCSCITQKHATFPRFAASFFIIIFDTLL